MWRDFGIVEGLGVSIENLGELFPEACAIYPSRTARQAQSTNRDSLVDRGDRNSKDQEILAVLAVVDDVTRQLADEEPTVAALG